MSLISDPRAASESTDELLGAPADRWAAVGHACGGTARELVARAYGSLDLVEHPELLLVFASSALDPESVSATLRDLAPGVATVGCTSSAELSGAGPMEHSVVIMALGGAGIRCRTAMVPIVDGDVRAATAEATRCIDELDRLESTVMVLLVDGEGVDHDDIVRGAYETVGPTVPLVGGCGCGPTLDRGVTVFHTSGVSTRAVVAAAMTSNGPIGIGLGHGFTPAGEPQVVTSSGRNVVATLGERPALDAYLVHHGAGDDLLDDPVRTADFLRSRPLGIVRRGRVEPRSVIGIDPLERTLTTGGVVPQGGIVWFMDGDRESALGAVEVAAADSLAPLAGADALATVVFDCGARRAILGVDGLRREVDRLTAAAGGPIAGFYTFGEIARTSGSTGFHNLTAVLLTFG